jgi:hypothetical protein
MGANMTPSEFIRKNLVDQLTRDGCKAVDSLADEGLRYWRESAQFKKGAWAETLAYTRKRAKAQGVK